MLKVLVQRFVPNAQDVNNESVRTAYGVLAGGMGIVINLALFAVKLPIGIAMQSIAIMSDAFNNISDMGSSLVCVIGAKMALRKPDREHPFGHGRIEYLSALIVALLILVVGVELFKESVMKFLHPEPVRFNPLLLGILALSIGGKLFMYYYNRVFAGRIHSQVMRATASDSLNDVCTTAAVVLATVVGRFVDWPMDAIAGLAVSLFILYSGYGIARDTMDLLLGGRPDPALMHNIAAIVRQGEDVINVHDLILHDYGPGRMMASIHAEVPDDADIVKIHETLDALETRVQQELGVPIVIHTDPIAVNDAQVNEARAQVDEAIRRVDSAYTFHDFRMVNGENRINLIFDLVVPCECTQSARADAIRRISAELAQRDARYRCVIQVDDNFAD